MPPPSRTARASASSTRHLKILVNPTLSQLSQTSDIRHRPCPHRQSSSCRRYSPPHGHRSPSLIGPADGSLLGGRFSTDPRLRALRALRERATQERQPKKHMGLLVFSVLCGYRPCDLEPVPPGVPSESPNPAASSSPHRDVQLLCRPATWPSMSSSRLHHSGNQRCTLGLWVPSPTTSMCTPGRDFFKRVTYAQLDYCRLRTGSPCLFTGVRGTLIHIYLSLWVFGFSRPSPLSLSLLGF